MREKRVQSCGTEHPARGLQPVSPGPRTCHDHGFRMRTCNSCRVPAPPDRPTPHAAQCVSPLSRSRPLGKGRLLGFMCFMTAEKTEQLSCCRKPRTATAFCAKSLGLPGESCAHRTTQMPPGTPQHPRKDLKAPQGAASPGGEQLLYAGTVTPMISECAGKARAPRPDHR